MYRALAWVNFLSGGLSLAHVWAGDDPNNSHFAWFLINIIVGYMCWFIANARERQGKEKDGRVG